MIKNSVNLWFYVVILSVTESGKEYFNKNAKFAEGGEVLKVTDGENIWYLTYLDSTHFFLSNTPDFKGSPYHIGQFRSYPYYKQVDEWLKGETRKRMTMADGGMIEEVVDGNTEIKIGNWIFYFKGVGNGARLTEIYHKPTDLDASWDTTYHRDLAEFKNSHRMRKILK